MDFRTNFSPRKISFYYIRSYYFKLLNIAKSRLLRLRVPRANAVSNAVCNSIVYVHQGRTWVGVRLSRYHVGQRFGSFACTKKPFFFRPKKKKQKKR